MDRGSFKALPSHAYITLFSISNYNRDSVYLWHKCQVCPRLKGAVWGCNLSPWHPIYDSSVTRRDDQERRKTENDPDFQRWRRQKREILWGGNRGGSFRIWGQIERKALLSVSSSMIPLAAEETPLHVRIINLGNGANWGGRRRPRQTIFIIRASTLITHVCSFDFFHGRSWFASKELKKSFNLQHFILIW